MSAATLDDLLRRVIEHLLSSKNRIEPTKGPATELAGVLLQITNPRARLSRTEAKGTLFSCLGELLWYLAGTNSLAFISYYLPHYKKFSDDGRTVWGGYGPRLFNQRGVNQVQNVIALLKRKQDSRQAVIQLFDAEDIVKPRKDIPCTCTLQFMIRRRRLHLFVSMRSNDAFLGLPHDIFSFTMLQEIVARSLSIEVGRYKHFAASLHLYDEHRKGAQRFLDEGWQTVIPMETMPIEDPWPAIAQLLKAEKTLRAGRGVDIESLKLHRYWIDLVRLLNVFRNFKDKNSKAMISDKKKLSSDVFGPYIDQKRKSINNVVQPYKPSQPRLL